MSNAGEAIGASARRQSAGNDDDRGSEDGAADVGGDFDRGDAALGSHTGADAEPAGAIGESRDLVDDGACVLPMQMAAPLAAAALPRFCRDCGAAWQAEWLECEACATVRRLRSAANAATAGGGASAGPSGSLEGTPRALGSAMALYFTLLAASLVGLIASQIGAEDFALELSVSLAHSAIVVVWCVPTWRSQILPALRQPVGPQWFLIGAGGALVTFAAATGVVETMQRLFDVPQLGYTETIFDAGFGWPMAVLLICVQPAIFEELAFRGVIQSRLQPVLSPGEAIGVSALLFMILHLSVPSFPHLLLIGLALGYLRVRTGSLLPGMLLHFTHNLLCIVSEGMRL